MGKMYWKKGNVVPTFKKKKLEYLSGLVNIGIPEKNVEKLKWTLLFKSGMIGALLLPVGMTVCKKMFPQAYLMFS